MGCCHVMKNNHEAFKDIIWYSERWDKRLGFVFLIQNSFMSQLGAILDPANTELFKTKCEIFRNIFVQTPDAILTILKVGETLRVVDSRLSPQLPKNTVFLCIESFVKDLNDEVNLRRLKNFVWTSSDIWQVISTAILVCATLEANDLAVHPIRRQNFVFSQSRIKYYCDELFAPTSLTPLPRTETALVCAQFAQRRKELALTVLAIVLKLPEGCGAAVADLDLETEELLSRVEGEQLLEPNLASFIGDVLWKNTSALADFQELKLQTFSQHNAF